MAKITLQLAGQKKWVRYLLVHVHATQAVNFLNRQLKFGMKRTETETSICSNKKFQIQYADTCTCQDRITEVIWILKVGERGLKQL